MGKLASFEETCHRKKLFGDGKMGIRLKIDAVSVVYRSFDQLVAVFCRNSGQKPKNCSNLTETRLFDGVRQPKHVKDGKRDGRAAVVIRSSLLHHEKSVLSLFSLFIYSSTFVDFLKFYNGCFFQECISFYCYPVSFYWLLKWTPTLFQAIRRHSCQESTTPTTSR